MNPSVPILAGLALLVVLATAPQAAAAACTTSDPPLCVDDSTPEPSTVRLPHGEGECSGPILWGGPVVCNLLTQFICEGEYNGDCDAWGPCRGEGGHLRNDWDRDRDGQCDSDGDVDDDNDGVPDDCDPHPDNQDIVQETVDYIRYYVFRGSHC